MVATPRFGFLPNRNRGRLQRRVGGTDPAPALRMSKILTVEDDPDLASVIALNLERAGHTVHTAGDGESAMVEMREFQPDLVLLDVVLPDIVGFSLCEMLRRVRPATRVPIIIVSGCREPESQRIGLELGADEYITKPFSPRELVCRVQARLGALPRAAV